MVRNRPLTFGRLVILRGLQIEKYEVVTRISAGVLPSQYDHLWV